MQLPVLNNQPREKAWHHPDGRLAVHKIFDTIQGEGPYVGCSATFVRLSGCNLQCPGCDTIYTDPADAVMTPAEIVSTIQKMTWGKRIGKKKLVVITGGEPLRQNVVPLIKAIADAGMKSQIETNGTMFVPGLTSLLLNQCDCIIICSPKTPSLHRQIIPLIHTYKYVMDSENVDPTDGLPSITLGGNRPARPEPEWKGTILLHPTDPGSKTPEAVESYTKNIASVVESCMKFGYRLGLQVHKYLGME
jgi:organic radical activating enzyme